MKKTHYFWILALVLSMSSCTKELLEVNEQPSNVVNDNFAMDEVWPGWVRIKLEETAEPLRVGAFTRGDADSGNPELDRIANMLGATEVQRVFSDGGKFAERRRKYGLHLWYDVHFDESVPVTRAASEMSSIHGIAHVEPIHVITLAYDKEMLVQENIYHPVPVQTADDDKQTNLPFDDPYLNYQWHYHNDGTKSGSVAGADINLFEAWKIETGNPSVIVSIHDDGIKWDHEDLAANMWVNEAEIAGNNQDDDNNGYRDDIYGYNFISSTGNIYPGTHGTHVAGTVAAVNNNGIGLCGVAGGDGEHPGVRLMSVQIQHENVFASNSKAAESFVYAADNGAVISQNSWTFLRSTGLPQIYSDVFDYFNDNAGTDENGNQTGPMKGGIIIFATGNAGSDTFVPAASDKVIAVSSITADMRRCISANYGPNTDIMAPGGYSSSPQIYSTDITQSGKDTYSYLWGTSMACPHVSGVAALIVSHFGGPGFTAQECKTRLLNAYKPLGEYLLENELNKTGVGLVDAYAAMVDEPKTAPDPVAAPSVSAENNYLNLTVTVPADGNGYAVAKFLAVYKNRQNEQVTKELINKYDIGQTVSFKFMVEYNMSYDLDIIAVDRWGNQSTGVQLSVTTDNFVNKPPVLRNSIHDAGLNYGETTEYDLYDYFYDANEIDGDVLTFEATTTNDNIINVSVDGSILSITTIAKGTASVVVTAVDIAGEMVETSFRVIVKNGPEPSTNTETNSQLVINANPVENQLTFSVAGCANKNARVVMYDSAAREVLNSNQTLDDSGTASVNVASLAPGTYALTVSVDNNRFSTSFVKK